MMNVFIHLTKIVLLLTKQLKNVKYVKKDIHLIMMKFVNNFLLHLVLNTINLII